MKMRASVCEPILDVYDAIGNARQPVVALVQGKAHGFGSAVAGACDLTIAADNARFRLPEMEKDLPPTLAISALMARVPRKALTWLVYSMEEIDAHAALQLGIVQPRRYRPGDPHQGGSAHIVGSLRLAGTGRRADPAVTHSERVLQMKHLTNLTHRQSLRRHRQSPLGEGAAIR